MGGNPFNLRDIKDKVRINISDMRDPFAMGYLVQDQDFLFNLAGQTSHIDSMTEPQTDLAINVTAQLSLLETCVPFAIRFSCMNNLAPPFTPIGC